jgi:hypothetical protein
MREEFNPLNKFYCTRPDSYRDVPAAKTKSIGLQANASASWRIMVFARHLDNFIVT